MKARQEVYDTYWKTAFERQNIFFRKIEGESHLTTDPIFKTYKFCNVYRACDRVSQYLIKNVIYSDNSSEKDTLFRVFLFRLLNKNETWDKLENTLGDIKLSNFDFDHYSATLQSIKSEDPIYGNAFILCANKAFGYDKKHENHLALLNHVFRKESVITNLINSKSLETLFKNLRELPLIGDFMAYQLSIDFNYSEVFDFSENDFTIAGPGAIRGIKKCFVDTDGKDSAYIIKYMVENQDKEFERLGLDFKNLWGRKMHAIDCQNWFCETDKYCRIQFPQLLSNRSKIKSKYKSSKSKIDYFYPPKWGIIPK